MKYLSITMPKNNEYVEYAITNARHGEEVDCCDLVSMIDPSSGWSLGQAYAINNLGWIVGDGPNGAGEKHAFLLIVKPPPTRRKLTLNGNQ